ncbi:hypothetical protein GF322_01000 [Candidatus Dependentiae bacterium]|nr:hypothetical protein [Candidatus Dependentiae bacterium]
MSTTLSLSLELIYLMNWLLKNDKNKLKKIIEESIKSGLAQEIDQIDNFNNDFENLDSIHNSILDFLFFMEDTLLEALEKKDSDFIEKEKLKPTIQKINSQKIDLKTLWMSIQQTKIKNTSKKDLKKLLLSELIKNWRPKKNEPVN